MSAELIATLMAVLAIGGFLWLVPKCPECGFLLSIRNSHDPGLRHCRRCMSIYHSRERR
jgi:hypothetical protein